MWGYLIVAAAAIWLVMSIIAVCWAVNYLIDSHMERHLNRLEEKGEP